jgi:mono/diheme cytochrome c family protein
LIDAMRARLIVLSMLWCAPWHAACRAQDADDEFAFLPGIVSEQRRADGLTHLRIEPGVVYRRGPMTGLPTAATWRGALQALVAGEYQLAAELSGELSIALDDQTVLQRVGSDAVLVPSEPFQLTFGEHALEIRLQPTDERNAELRLFWRGPGFRWEPLRAPHLVHAAKDPSESNPTEQAWETWRCGACHGTNPVLPAPSLVHSAGNLNRDWLVERLTEDAAHGDEILAGPRVYGEQMPQFAMTRDEAVAIADYLGAAIEPDAEANEGDAEPGEELFLTVGCLACHRVGEVGFSGPYGGGSLDQVGHKRPAGFFERWLTNPTELNVQHRMPVFDLSQQERKDLAAFLSSLRDEKTPVLIAAGGTERRQEGARLIERFRCGGCHEMPQGLAKTAPVPTEIGSHRAACSGRPDASQGRPGYRLPEKLAQALETRVKNSVRSNESTDAVEVLQRANCGGCHSRQGEWRGIATCNQELGASHPELAARLQGLVPPALDGVGDKLTDEVLERSVAGEGPRRRPWLEVRMPHFRFSQAERELLAGYFRSQDRVPDALVDHVETADRASAWAAGRRLVTSDGFGCTSCHQIGSVVPDQVQIRARGPKLNGAPDYLRREWFERFVRAPARIVPQMEMPSIQLPVRGVLDEKLDGQLAAVWEVLKDERFEPPQPNPIRIVRQANDPSRAGRAVVMTDLIQVGKQEYVKPLVVGLPNRHNVLLDFATQRLAAWWTGDTALQRTRKKSWYWESGGPTLWQDGKKTRSELEVLVDGEWQGPTLRGQFVSEFDWYEHREGGIAFGQSLSFPSTEGSDAVAANLTQMIQPYWRDENGSSGVIRTISWDESQSGRSWRFLLGKGFEVAADDARLAHAGHLAGKLTVRIAAPASARWRATPEGPVIELAGEGQQRLSLEYVTDVAVDRFEPAPPVETARTAERLEVMPGFQATELPLDTQVMPTGLAWGADGCLVVTSLKGQVLKAVDRDGDGWEDEYQSLGVELASPFGLAAQGQAWDVINKYALLRLKDQDGDGQTDRVERLASGWGHTDDYHDWAVGLPRDEQGNYYIALPCQQDRRSEAESYLRGQALRLGLRQPGETYAVEPICRGLRFPMGLSWSERWGLLFTDNQGNYTPFNELNQLLPQRHYGFVNRNEREETGPVAVESPAVEIPHPWTRSVNGICLLETPSNVAARGVSWFGPWEGHLLGCEYDTRRLVRMSLEKVGQQLQGAVYPASSEPAEGQRSFEGPLCCQVSPTGEVYVGNIRDSGWGGGSNTGSIVRLRSTGELPLGIAEIRVRPRGFAIHFTGPVDPGQSNPEQSVSVTSYRRQRTPEYGGADLDRTRVKVNAWQWRDGDRVLELECSDMKLGYVYEIHIGDLTSRGTPLFPNEAYYTLRALPAE